MGRGGTGTGSFIGFLGQRNKGDQSSVQSTPNSVDALHEALLCQDYARVEKLVSEKAFQPEWLQALCQKTRSSPLHIACTNGHLELVKLLLAKGSPIDQREGNEQAFTPLLCAASQRHFHLVKVLLDQGADPLLSSEGGSTVLHYLIRTEPPLTDEQKEKLSYCIFSGSDLNAQNRYGETPLHQACARKHVEMVQFLLENLAQVDLVNKFGETALHKAVLGSMEDASLLKVLFKFNADPTIVSANGTPLDLLKAERHRNEEVFAALEEYTSSFVREAIDLNEEGEDAEENPFSAKETKESEEQEKAAVVAAAANALVNTPKIRVHALVDGTSGSSSPRGSVRVHPLVDGTSGSSSPRGSDSPALSRPVVRVHPVVDSTSSSSSGSTTPLAVRGPPPTTSPRAPRTEGMFGLPEQVNRLKSAPASPQVGRHRSSTQGRPEPPRSMPILPPEMDVEPVPRLKLQGSSSSPMVSKKMKHLSDTPNPVLVSASPSVERRAKPLPELPARRDSEAEVGARERMMATAKALEQGSDTGSPLMGRKARVVLEAAQKAEEAPRRKAVSEEAKSNSGSPSVERKKPQHSADVGTPLARKKLSAEDRSNPGSPALGRRSKASPDVRRAKDGSESPALQRRSKDYSNFRVSVAQIEDIDDVRDEEGTVEEIFSKYTLRESKFLPTVQKQRERRSQSPGKRRRKKRSRKKIPAMTEAPRQEEEKGPAKVLTTSSEVRRLVRRGSRTDLIPMFEKEHNFRAETSGFGQLSDLSLVKVARRYANEFFPRDHLVFMSPKKGVVCIVCESNRNSYSVLVFEPKGYEKKAIPAPQLEGKNFIMGCLNWIALNVFPQSDVFLVDEDNGLRDELYKMEGSSQELSNCFRVGVVHCTSGQTTEAEMFKNPHGNKKFLDFLSVIGEEIQLKDWKGFRGQLSVHVEGKSYYTKFKGTEIMYHVATLLDAEQQRRLIGNDTVIIYFHDAEGETFPVEAPRSVMGQVFVVVQPMGPHHYRVGVLSRKPVAEFGPAMPLNPVFDVSKREGKELFKLFLLCKVVNGYSSAVVSPPLDQMLRRPRAVVLEELAEKWPLSKAKKKHCILVKKK